MQSKNNITKDVFGLKGYHVALRLNEIEIDELRGLVRQSWLARLEELLPSEFELFNRSSMEKYHEFAHLIDHKSVWPKSKRLLDQSAVNKVKKFDFYRRIEDEYGECSISNEENKNSEEICWRIVRPNCDSDVGPVHADKWFWHLNNWQLPQEKIRVKVWIGIFFEEGESGFKFLPGSHQLEWPYQSESRHGYIKPLEPTCINLALKRFQGRVGDIIIFNDSLLHGGYVGGSSTRVSVEFTIFLNKSRVLQEIIRSAS